MAPSFDNFDPSDRAIIDTLQQDGRITNVELAERVGLSPSACLRRVRQLEDLGVIRGYVALLDADLVGRPTTVFVEVSLSSQTEEALGAFEAAIADAPEVMECHLMAGDADYLVKVQCADVADYARIHRQYLAVLPGVVQVRSSFALRAVLATTALDLG
ncbi:MAG: Lrp/AsnC family transcriptional regulator [Actinomycetota bacterium]